MTALSDALEQAQTRAVAVLAKQYVGGEKAGDDLRHALDALGLTDAVDQNRWIIALEVIRNGGGEAPAETNGKPKPEPASDKQTAFIAKLLAEKGVVPDDFPDSPLTKDQAHEIIDTLQAGTYEPSKWKLPF